MLIFNDLHKFSLIRHFIAIIQIVYERKNPVIRMNHKRTKRVCEKSEKKNIEHKEAVDHPVESIFQGIVS
jgi:hypothetical protein